MLSRPHAIIRIIIMTEAKAIATTTSNTITITIIPWLQWCSLGTILPIVSLLPSYAHQPAHKTGA